ncbi:Flp pilus assembly protein CpaB [Xinfangfangia sp. D13-10-4-6]|uniref:Flp pilus assembly protein CpaB n=1 Tax=Pseudogemmobacter hezensis TaxID=2737662 RepID=UPI00155184FB|nr:Flp pilus assembly protein CpaB [Pseudogemmobacter hezensis]NPD15287.1 Flp pilus assembly protein CpaB [Pseudogemmobacter hezensis]
MRAIFGIVLIIGVALAGFAVYMAQGYIQSNEVRMNAALERERQTGELVQVFSVIEPVKYGGPIEMENVQQVWVQKQFMPANAYTDGYVLFPENATRPRFSMRPLEANEILLSSRLTEPGEVAGIAGKLGPGMSAFQIRVSSNSGVAGFIMPGDYIDIYWTGSSDTGDITKRIEAGMQVIAVDQTSDQSTVRTSEASTVTVAASSEQVGRLTLAQSTGRLSMAGVSGPGEGTADTIEVDSYNLLGTERAQAEVVEEEKICTTKTRKGGELVETQIPCPTN